MIRLRNILTEVISEIGDRVTTDNIVDTKIGNTRSSIQVEIGEDIIEVEFRLKEGENYANILSRDIKTQDVYKFIKSSKFAEEDDEWGFIEVSFFIVEDDPTYDVSNRGNPLEVMSAVSGAVSEFLKQYRYVDVMGLMFSGKEEFDGDRRRERLYNKFTERNIKSIARGEIRKTELVYGDKYILYYSDKPLNA